MDKMPDPKPQMWFGFLFMRGGKNSSATIIKNRLENLEGKENCRFRYIESIEDLEANGLTSGSMETYDQFTKNAK